MQLKKHGKSAVRALLHQAGGLQAVRYWNRNGARILMYHDFPSVPGLQEALAKQCAHLARHYEMVSLTDVGRYVREGKPLPKNALAVTVDDGNRDFLINGYPVFYAHKIPVTVYLVSGFLDGQLWLWWDQIRYAFENSRRASFELSLAAGRPPVHFPMATDDERQAAISTIAEAMKPLSAAERDLILNTLFKLLGVELPHEPPPHMAPMQWSEVRRIADHGVEVGAHTVTHPVLSRVTKTKELQYEIEHSKSRIEEELRRPVTHFCYPYGRSGDFNEETIKILDRCQFQTAVTAEHGLNSRTSDPFRLKRLSVDALFPEYYFQERVAGLHQG